MKGSSDADGDCTEPWASPWPGAPCSVLIQPSGLGDMGAVPHSPDGPWGLGEVQHLSPGSTAQWCRGQDLDRRGVLLFSTAPCRQDRPVLTQSLLPVRVLVCYNRMP